LHGKGGLLTDGFWGLWISQLGEVFFVEGFGELFDVGEII
jgi:hypothetical protein